MCYSRPCRLCQQRRSGPSTSILRLLIGTSFLPSPLLLASSLHFFSFCFAFSRHVRKTHKKYKTNEKSKNMHSFPCMHMSLPTCTCHFLHLVKDKNIKKIKKSRKKKCFPFRWYSLFYVFLKRKSHKKIQNT